MSTVDAGIDVSKDQLDVHVAGQDGRFAHQRVGYRALGTWLKGHGAGRVVVRRADGARLNTEPGRDGSAVTDAKSPTVRHNVATPLMSGSGDRMSSPLFAAR